MPQSPLSLQDHSKRPTAVADLPGWNEQLPEREDLETSRTQKPRGQNSLFSEWQKQKDLEANASLATGANTD